MLAQAGARLRRLQSALRLWDDAEPSVGPSAYARTGAGPWLHVPLASGVRRSLDDCLLEPEEEDPLRAFIALVDRRTPRGGELAWALRRFELGCERPSATEALTDWLLAGRALLVDTSVQGYDGLADRLGRDLRAPRGGQRRALTETLQPRRWPRAFRRGRAACAPKRRRRPSHRHARGLPARGAARRPLRPPRPRTLRGVADDLLAEQPEPVDTLH